MFMPLIFTTIILKRYLWGYTAQEHNGIKFKIVFI